MAARASGQYLSVIPSRVLVLAVAPLLALAACGSSGSGSTALPAATTASAAAATPPVAETSAGLTSASPMTSAAPTTPAAQTSSRAAPASAAATTFPAAATSPIPKGFQIADLSWISATEGWLLGAAPAGGGKVTSVLLHTTDGGASWSSLTAPPVTVPLSSNAGVGCEKMFCASGIRFANAHVGYVYGSNSGTQGPTTSSAMTTDGGRTWTTQPGPPVVALEPGPADVLRVTDEGGCPPGCTYHLQRSSIGSTTWTNVTTPGLGGDAIQLLRAGSDDYLVEYKNPAGGAQSEQPSYVVSHDGGATWGTGQDPCLSIAPNGKEVDTNTAAAAPGGVLTVLCSPRDGQSKPTLLRSTNAGHTFTSINKKPATGTLVQLSATTLLTVGSLTVQRSTDGGATSTSVLTLPKASTTGGPDTLASRSYAGSQDATTARVVSGTPEIFTTHDGGATWSSYSFA